MSPIRWMTPLALTGLVLAVLQGAPAAAQTTEPAKVPAKAKAKVEAKVKAKADAKPAAEPKPEQKAEPKPKATAKPKAPAKIEPVNINTDDADTLQELPGVGPVLAKAIIDGRPYKSVDDLAKVDGFGPAKIEAVRKHVRIEVPKPAEPKKAAAKPASPKSTAPKAAAKPKEATKTESKPLADGKTININKATAEELEELPGIGPVKAKAIIDGRPFAKPEDVMKVRGIKDETFGKIKAHITVK